MDNTKGTQGRISLNLKVSIELYEKLLAQAKSEDRSISYIARRILLAGIKPEEK
jgi:hypothetical protein